MWMGVAAWVGRGGRKPSAQLGALASLTRGSLLRRFLLQPLHPVRSSRWLCFVSSDDLGCLCHLVSVCLPIKWPFLLAYKEKKKSLVT